MASKKPPNIANTDYGLPGYNFLSLQWADVKTCVRTTRISRSVILKIAKDPASGVKSILFKSNPMNTSGKRLIFVPSLLDFVQKQIDAAQAGRAELEKILQ